MKSAENIFDFFKNESDWPDLDVEGAVQRLSAAVQCRTISDCVDQAPFLQIHALIRNSYPNLMRFGTMEFLDRSVLITVPGSDPALRPALFMSHLDVVPVVAGTEQDWTHGAFSGDISDGYIWGRGTLDIKDQVFGALEAAEYLLSHGEMPRRGFYLAFGQDEETFNTGALAIAELLRSRGVTLEFLLDEGGGKITSGAAYGAPDVFVSTIDLMEKGYADLELSVKSEGGHSSRPFGGTSLGILSEAISSITRNPFPAEISPVMEAAFRALAPYIAAEPLRSLLSDLAGNRTAIAEYCMGQPVLFPHVTTTIAPTVIRGSSAACNVMPQNMEAVINFRIAAGHTPEAIMERCRSLINDPRVSLRFLQANPPSAIARIDGTGYSALTQTLERYFQDLVFVPFETAGATDAHQYECICDTCLRFSPFMAPESEANAGVHGTNERISIRAYAQGIRAMIGLLRAACL